jgi:hypothetical protein
MITPANSVCRAVAVVEAGSFGGAWVSASLELAKQGATDQFGKTNLLAPRFCGQNLLGLFGETERHRHTALWQSRSGHDVCVLLYHIPCQHGIFLRCHIHHDTARGVRAKEPTAITITLPLALDRALQALADQKHCGNKSAAIREVLYKEAGMQAKLRMNEKKDNDSLAKAKHRSVKYGSRKKKSKNKVLAHRPDFSRQFQEPPHQ